MEIGGQHLLTNDIMKWLFKKIFIAARLNVIQKEYSRELKLY